MSRSDNFKGWLIRFPDSNLTDKFFPHKLMKKESYQSTPLQRTDIKNYRDNDYLLHRTTSPNHKTKIEFQTINLSLRQLEQIQICFEAATMNTKERKIRVEYWDEELLRYRTMTCYRPDITYTTSTISKNDIKYLPITIKFIEY